MSVFYYAPGPRGFLYEWHHHHFISEFRARGIDVVACNPYDEGASLSAEGWSERLLAEFRRARETGRANFFLAVATDETITGAAVDEIRRLGVPTVNMSTDDLVVPYRVRGIARHFDLTWTIAQAAAPVMRRYGGRVEYLPPAANPFTFAPAPAEERRAVGFLGRCYGVRAIRLRQLARAGVDVVRFDGDRAPAGRAAARSPLARAASTAARSATHVAKSLAFPSGRQCVWSALVRSTGEPGDLPGDGTPAAEVTWAPAPSFEDLGRTYSSLGLSLGSTEVGSTYVLKTPVLFPRLREFEAPMCGAVHLVNRSDDLRACFDEDVEMLYYGSAEEMVDKARFYLDPRRDAARAAIRVAARRRAAAEHTWHHRYGALRRQLGLPAAA